MTEIHIQTRLSAMPLLAYGQTLDSHLGQLRAAGCSGRNIYGEKVTGGLIGASLTRCSPS